MNKVTVFYQKNGVILRKVVRYLKDHDVEFEAVKINAQTFPFEYFLKCLEYCENGTDGLLSERSKTVAEMEESGLLDALTLKGLWIHILKKPNLLRLPLCVDSRFVIIGGNKGLEEMSAYLPKPKKSDLRKYLK